MALLTAVDPLSTDANANGGLTPDDTRRVALEFLGALRQKRENFATRSRDFGGKSACSRRRTRARDHDMSEHLKARRYVQFSY